MLVQPPTSPVVPLDFASNLNPWGPPPSVVRALREHGGSMLASYPEHPPTRNLATVAEWWGLPFDTVALANGATELILGCMSAFARREGVIAAPTFWQFGASARRAGGKVHKIPTQAASGFRLDERALEATIGALPAQESCVFLCNPNNPTGVLLSRDFICELVERYSSTLFVVDETYLLFRSDVAQVSVKDLASRRDNLIVIASLSKFFAVPGLRIGIAAASPPLAERLQAAMTPFGVNNVAQCLLPVMLGDVQFQLQSRSYFDFERKRVGQRWRELTSTDFARTEANYFLVRRPHARDETTCAAFLLKRGLKVRCGSELDDLHSEYVRFCLRRPEENDCLVSALAEYTARAGQPGV